MPSANECLTLAAKHQPESLNEVRAMLVDALARAEVYSQTRPAAATWLGLELMALIDRLDSFNATLSAASALDEPSKADVKPEHVAGYL